MNLSINTKRDWSNVHFKDSPVDLDKLLHKNLFGPLEEFFKTPGKNIRTRLVEIGYLLASHKSKIDKDDLARIILGGQIVEAIHSGALIVDDIEDGSLLRRETETLHLKYGVPLALNAGNWLYFHGLTLIQKLGLSPETTVELVNECLDLMLKAHYGQAIDLGTSIDKVPQEDIKGLCLASLELKTGTLMCLALRIGWAIGGGRKKNSAEIQDFGMRFGIALQMFDDVGNFLQEKTEAPSKRQEDLKLKRPSWIWAVASSMDSQDYEQFLRASNKLDDEELMDDFINSHDFRNKLLVSATWYLEDTMSRCHRSFGNNSNVLALVREICQILERAYV